MAGLPLEQLRLLPMASGWEYLLLTERVSWDDFPAYAEAVVARIGGRLGDRIDSGGQRVWRVDWQGLGYWITWDDLDPGVSIEPCDRVAGERIGEIRGLLMQG